MVCLMLFSVRARASGELLVNGGFEEGTMNGWTVVGANPTWEPPTYNPPHQYEGDYYVYINPYDHGDITVSQQVPISTAYFTLSFAVLPHISYSPGDPYHIRAVYITAYDFDDNVLIDTDGKSVELLYSLVGEPTTSGYNLTFDLELRDPNTEPYYYFQQNFFEDYQNAGGNPTDWSSASYIIIAFTAREGGGGTSWDAFSLVLASVQMSIYTDKYSYSAGDTMYLGLDVTNPNGEKNLCFVIWVIRPDDSIYLYLHHHNIFFPAEFTYINPFFRKIVLPSLIPGYYTWHAALIDSSAHMIIVEDIAEWEFS
jgi:hypothetical protein